MDHGPLRRAVCVASRASMANLHVNRTPPHRRSDSAARESKVGSAKETSNIATRTTMVLGMAAGHLRERLKRGDSYEEDSDERPAGKHAKRTIPDTAAGMTLGHRATPWSVLP